MSSSAPSRPKPARLPSRSDSTRIAGPPADAREPDDKAVEDVYQTIEETGSLEAAAKKLQKYSSQRTWEDDPEEEGYLAQHQHEDEEDQMMVQEDGQGRDELEEVVHLQEVFEGLWIGDLVSAMDSEGLKERGITNILSLLRPRLDFGPNFTVYPLEIDDGPDTDILTHLPSCVAWIHEALGKRRMTFDADSLDNATLPPRDKAIDRIAGETSPGGVLVHCQAGMSRSATVVAAFLMQVLELGPVEAVEMIREKRPVVDPSDTFWYQLGLLYNADGRVSLRDRATRQFYMERTTSQFMNGDGGAPPLDKMAKYPATPTPSNPPTPSGGHGRRKIRCKMCRRHLAVREHMMDHILDQSPISRPRTPSNFALPSPRGSFSHIQGFTSTNPPSTTERRPSAVSDITNPLTGLPGAVRSRQASMSSGVPTPVSGSFDKEKESKDTPLPSPGGVPLPRACDPDLALTSVSDSGPTPSNGDVLSDTEMVATPLVMSRRQSADSHTSNISRPLQTADQLSSRLPLHLQALRSAGGSISALSSPFNRSPESSPDKEVSSHSTSHPFPVGGVGHGRSKSQSSAALSGSATGVGRRMSVLAMTPADGQPRERKVSGRGGEGSIPTSGPPILVNPKCSGYFVEPLTWMEPILRDGQISGKIVCPNEKCGAKIGTFDWAGVQCGCKEWVTPGFCIHRSKVDEVW